MATETSAIHEAEKIFHALLLRHRLVVLPVLPELGCLVGEAPVPAVGGRDAVAAVSILYEHAFVAQEVKKAIAIEAGRIPRSRRWRGRLPRFRGSAVRDQPGAVPRKPRDFGW